MKKIYQKPETLVEPAYVKIPIFDGPPVSDSNYDGESPIQTKEREDDEWNTIMADGVCYGNLW